MDSAKGRWVEELPSILWAYQTTPKRSTGETPFFITYGVEAVISVEVSLCSAKVKEFTLARNDGWMVECLDLLEEYQEAAIIQLAEYQQKLARCYNQYVRTRKFSVKDQVLRKAVGNMWDTNVGKLEPTGEGPYMVTTIAGARAYYLEDIDERPLPQPSNVHNLKKFYH